MTQRGSLRDHRPDCKQLVIALVVNTGGFPLSYETFDGNRADVTSLEAVVRMVERKYGRARRCGSSTGASSASRTWRCCAAAVASTWWARRAAS